MIERKQTWRGLNSVFVLLIVCEFGRPVKMNEIKEKTDFNIVSLCLHYWAKRGYVEHDVGAHTWCITPAGRVFLQKFEDMEREAWIAWETRGIS